MLMFKFYFTLSVSILSLTKIFNLKSFISAFNSYQLFLIGLYLILMLSMGNKWYFCNSWTSDSLSIWMSLLTLFLNSILMVLIELKFKQDRFLLCSLIMMIMTMGLLIVFNINNLLIYFVMFEMLLIPIYLIIMMWGYQPERIQAGLYMMIYTMMFSLPFLLLILFMYTSNNELKFVTVMTSTPLGFSELLLLPTSILIIIMVMIFMVKLPMYLVHLWLPKAHVEAPTIGSMILAAILLKLGGYGLIRIITMISMNMFIKNMFMTWAVIGAIMSSIMCLSQNDLKALIAYSSVMHMSLVTLSSICMKELSNTGGLALMIAHGFSSSMLFYMVGMFFDKTSSRSLMILKGWAMMSGLTTMIWFLALASNMSAPLSLNLLSEMFIFNGVVNTNIMVLFFLVIFVMMSGIYNILAFFMTIHGNSFTFMAPSVMTEVQKLPSQYSIISFTHLVPLNFLFFFLLTL